MEKEIVMNSSSNISEHMGVVGSDGAHVGTVDHLEGRDRIKLPATIPLAASITSFQPIGSIMSTTPST
jgi:Uncharacterized protein conserved in bacteria (DUF2171)